MSEGANGNSFPYYRLYDSQGQKLVATGAVAHVSEFGWGGEWGYQSEYSDASQPGLGLVYMHHRYYDPALGRFISADPIGYDDGLNLYSYCENDPINRVDPSGTDWARAAWDWLLGVFRVKVDPKAPSWRNRYRDAGLEQDEFIGRDVRRYNNGLGAAGAAACQGVNVAGTEVVRTMVLGGVSRALRGSGNAAEAAKHRTHLRLLEKYGQAGHRTLQNGRIRYYDAVVPASRPGTMAGRRVVREWDPATGRMRTWMETLDHQGRVRIVRPQTSGPKIHYMFDEGGRFVGTF
jgi:RHS repeat-associated protein